MSGKNKGIILTIVLGICCFLMALCFILAPFFAIAVMRENVQNGVTHVEEYE